MQVPNEELWSVAKEIAKQGLLGAMLVAFIVALATRKLFLAWYVVKLEGELDKANAKIAEMLQITTTTTATAAAAIEGFKRVLAELEELREDMDRIQEMPKGEWPGTERRRK